MIFRFINTNVVIFCLKQVFLYQSIVNILIVEKFFDFYCLKICVLIKKLLPLHSQNSGITKTNITMSKVCQITGKKAGIGNNVSHSKRRTKRKFDVNLFTKKFYWVEQDCWVSLNVSANGLRIINKLGLDAAIRRASEKGYL